MLVRIVTALALPIALIVLLRAAPSLDARWEDQPAHFWIVLVAGVVNGALAIAVTSGTICSATASAVSSSSVVRVTISAG